MQALSSHDFFLRVQRLKKMQSASILAIYSGRPRSRTPERNIVTSKRAD